MRPHPPEISAASRSLLPSSPAATGNGGQLGDRHRRPEGQSFDGRAPRSSDLDDAFERLISPLDDASAQPLKIVIPGEALSQDGNSLAQLLTHLVADYEDIDTLLDGLTEDESSSQSAAGATGQGQLIEDAIAFVSISELSDPQALANAVAPLQAAQAQLDVQFAKVRMGLDRLDVYRLSRVPSHQLMAVLQRQENLGTIQHLVDFLRSLNRAADAFESLALPKPHIRDFLRHLCTMPDWQEMGHLVRVLEAAVHGALRPSA